MDVTTIGAGIAAASNVGNLIKGITGALRESGKSEAISQVIELQMLVSDLIEKNRQLTNENHSLQGQLELKAKMRFEKPFYYQPDDSNPFCPQCWDGTRKAVRLGTSHWVQEGNAFSFHCHTCKSDFT